jgi:hypothetical protein
LTLSDVVVLAGSVDLTPETELGGTSGTSQILQGLLKEETVLISKIDSSPLVDRPIVLDDIRDETDGASSICALIITSFSTASNWARWL